MLHVLNKSHFIYRMLRTNKITCIRNTTFTDLGSLRLLWVLFLLYFYCGQLRVSNSFLLDGQTNQSNILYSAAGLHWTWTTRSHNLCLCSCKKIEQILNSVWKGRSHDWIMEMFDRNWMSTFMFVIVIWYFRSLYDNQIRCVQPGSFERLNYLSTLYVEPLGFILFYEKLKFEEPCYTKIIKHPREKNIIKHPREKNYRLK